MEIRVGNVVKRIKRDNTKFKEGEYGVVEKLGDYEGDDGIYIEGINEWQDLNYIEIVENIAIGDKVKRINNDINGAKEGEIYTIKKIKVNKCGECIQIQIEESSDEFWYLFKNFIVIKKGEGEKMEITHEEKENMKNELIEELKDFDTRSVDDDLRNITRRITMIRNQIRDKVHEMNNRYRDLKEEMVNYEKKKCEVVEKDFSSDVEALLNHKYVKDINIDKERKVIEIETDYINIYDEDGNKYAGNKYNLVFNYRNMAVYIYGLDAEYCRSGFWTNEDPHPHVDGDGGYPCLGNAGSMLCESMNEMEIYASFIIVFNFLQQVNTGDVAGKNIENWDCIDEFGNIIKNPKAREVYTCAICGWSTHDEDNICICEDCGDNICLDCSTYINNYGRVCEKCIEKEWIECDICGELEKKEEITELYDQNYCYECTEEYLTNCEDCGTLIRKGDAREFEGAILCDECFEKETITCEKCGEVVERSEAKEHLGEFYCEECYEEFMEEDDKEILELIIKEEIMANMEESTNED